MLLRPASPFPRLRAAAECLRPLHSDEGERDVQGRTLFRQAHSCHRRRHRARQGDVRALPVARSRNLHLRAAQAGLRGDGRRAHEGARRQGARLRRRHPRCRCSRCDGRGDFRQRPADRPRQQRRRQFHLAHAGFIAARLRCDRQHRHARHVLRDACRGKTLDRRQEQRQRRLDRRYLGAATADPSSSPRR